MTGYTRAPSTMRRPLTLPLVALLALSCSGAQRPRARDPNALVPVLGICLAGDAAARANEYSGLAWHGDELFLLPQWSPRGLTRARSQPGFTRPWLYRIPGARLRAWVDGRDRSPITPERVALDTLDLANNPDYQGFEAIAFDGDRAALVVERGDRDRMSGLLVTARLDPSRGVVLDRDALALDVPMRSDNHAYEALTRVDGSWLALFELNGMDTSCASTALRLDPRGGDPRAVAVEPIPYRVTDATTVDAQRRFWVTQYSYRDVGDTAECERSIRAVGCFQEAVDCDPREGPQRREAPGASRRRHGGARHGADDPAAEGGARPQLGGPGAPRRPRVPHGHRRVAEDHPGLRPVGRSAAPCAGAAVPERVSLSSALHGVPSAAR